MTISLFVNLTDREVFLHILYITEHKIFFKGLQQASTKKLATNLDEMYGTLACRNTTVQKHWGEL